MQTKTATQSPYQPPFLNRAEFNTACSYFMRQVSYGQESSQEGSLAKSRLEVTLELDDMSMSGYEGSATLEYQYLKLRRPLLFNTCSRGITTFGQTGLMNDEVHDDGVHEYEEEVQITEEADEEVQHPHPVKSNSFPKRNELLYSSNTIHSTTSRLYKRKPK
jgi:hypothetical protein